MSMDQNLQNYISFCRASGFTDRQIKAALASSGWTKDQIRPLFSPHLTRFLPLVLTIPVIIIIAIIIPSSKKTNLNSFTSPLHGYSFQYPSDWTVKETPDGATLWNSNLPIISLSLLTGPSAQEPPTSTDLQTVTTEPTSVADLPATQYTVTGRNTTLSGHPQLQTFLSTPAQTYLFRLAVTSPARNLQTYRTILDTFRLPQN